MGVRRSTGRGRVLIWGSLGFIWLLALRSCDWISVGFIGSIPSLFESAIHKQWGSLLTTVEHGSHADWDLGLVGTSCTEFRSTLRSQSFNGPRLIWLSDSPRRPSRLNSLLGMRSDFAVHRCSHSRVGGVTSSVSTFVSLGIPSFSITPSVPRSISSIIDHKLYLPPGSYLSKDLCFEDLLNPKYPFQVIRFPCRFSPSGYGRRSLSFGELCLAWDLPLWSVPKRVTKCFFEFVSTLAPIKSLTAIVDSIIPVLQLPPGDPIGLSPLRARPALVSDPRGTWLPALNAWLPPTWIDDSLVTEKAVKVDDSDIPTHLWDLRISLVLQSPTLLLDRLRDFMHRVACRRVFRSFCSFLRVHHGDIWTSWIRQSVNGGGEILLPFLLLLLLLHPSFAISGGGVPLFTTIWIHHGGSGQEDQLFYSGDGLKTQWPQHGTDSKYGYLPNYQLIRGNRNTLTQILQCWWEQKLEMYAGRNTYHPSSTHTAMWTTSLSPKE